jgi:DNA-binding transcriptional ArsR family regulator
MGERVRDAETGRYTDKYHPEDILRVIWHLGGRAATSEVAEAVGGSRDTIYKKLQSMENEGLVESQKAGGIRVWSFADGFWERSMRHFGQRCDLGPESSGDSPQASVPCSGTSEHDEHARNDGR